MAAGSQTPVADRVSALRQSMAQHGIDACVVLSSDPHLSEYLPEHWQIRQWLTGFDGSAGTLVVTADDAGLWVDSRYWEQADTDLAGTPVRPVYLGQKGVPDPASWLADKLLPAARVWLDFHTVSVAAFQSWEHTLQQRDIDLVGEPDLIAELWAGRPPLPTKAVYAHAPPYAVRSRAGNLAAVRATMREHGADWQVLSSLDDIAWLFNLRGADVPYNPVFLAHALIGATQATLFVDPGKLTDTVTQSLADDGVNVLDYDRVGASLSELPAEQTVMFDNNRLTVGLRSRFQHARTLTQPSPAQLLKACKTPQEVEHIRRTMEADGAALCEFFAWLEGALGKQTITELTIDEQITAARQRQPGFVSPSFGTIAGFNANGAMPHYQATAASHAVIEGDGLLLIDSGGQYLGGTTDITRVVPIGTPTEAQRTDFTLVLKGMIALSQAHFPAGTPGCLLDATARMPLWQAGLDFGHGTGHGVGYFLNVHEGPQSVSPRLGGSSAVGLRAGMVTSNEPGLYRPGQWGIRIENLILATPAQATTFGDFLKFETLTLCPIDTRVIQNDLLSSTERRWLNAYHTEVRQRLEPHLGGDAAAWLQQRTQPV